MLALTPLFVTATALLAAYTSAAPLSHTPANPTTGVAPTVFRSTDPTTYRIPTAVARDRARNPGEKEHINQPLPNISPAPANIQYHAAVKREIRGPFLHAPLIPSSFDIGPEKWYKKTKKHNGQVKPDNSLDRQAMVGAKSIEGEWKGQSDSSVA